MSLTMEVVVQQVVAELSTLGLSVHGLCQFMLLVAVQQDSTNHSTT